MIDPREMNAVLAKIRRIQELSKNLVASPHNEAEKIALDGEIQTWFAHRRGALLQAAQFEIRFVNLLGPIVAAAMNSVVASAEQQGQPDAAPGPAAQQETRKGATLAGEEAKLNAAIAARKAKMDAEREAKIEKVRAASDRASAQSAKLTDFGCTPIVRNGDLKDTIAGEPESKVTL